MPHMRQGSMKTFTTHILSHKLSGGKQSKLPNLAPKFLEQ